MRTSDKTEIGTHGEHISQIHEENEHQNENHPQMSSLEPQFGSTMEAKHHDTFRGIILDDFQKEAISYLRDGYDVLVSAPTGSGKTIIAEMRIMENLKDGKKSWYASPLKALSNDKYREFRKIYGEKNVGILTGDRRENTKAPILVGTTEIFRNIIIEEGINGEVDISFIVFDEAHWIADKERGVSWEEAIIFAPPNSQLLLLSATFPNVEEIALWISSVRKREVKVVQKTKRPVPLLWYSVGEVIKPLFKNGKIIENRTRFSTPKALHLLKKRNATPAIFFFSSRKECEENSLEIGELVELRKLNITDSHEMRKRAEFCESYLDIFPYIKDDPFVQNFIKTGVAPHHAGLLPSLKVLFEDALKEGLAHAIFATKTLASGIDVPARSVVIASKTTFDGEKERLLSPSEVAQMSGRAGRRGKDEVGYVFVSAPVGQEVAGFFGDIEPIRSSFYITPHLVLNLLKTLEPSQCVKFIRKSLKSFELMYLIEKWEKKKSDVEQKLKSMNEEFERIKPKEEKCTPKTKIDYLNTQENLKNSQRKIEELSTKIEILEKIISIPKVKNFPEEKNGKAKNKVIFGVDEKGKFGIVEHGDGFVVFLTHGGKKFIREKDVESKFRYTFEVELGSGVGRKIKDEILSYFAGKYKEEEKLVQRAKTILNKLIRIKRRFEEKNERREKELMRFPCHRCPSFSECTPVAKKIKELEEKLSKLHRENPDEVEKEFRNMIEFLRYLDYIDENDILTEKGWEASKLKNPRSIYIFEVLRKNIIDFSPGGFAASIALLLSEARPPFKKPPERIEKTVEDIYNLEVKFKLTPKIRPAEIFIRRRRKRRRKGGKREEKKLAFLDGKIYEAVLLWAEGYTIDEVEERTGVEMGDLSRMIVQTVEVLRQIETIYEYREVARQAIQKIYRSPVSDFVV